MSSSEKNAQVVISTQFGDVKIRLFDDTPLHRDNFLKLVEEGFYDGLTFHRVINSFMIQGGDPDSRYTSERLEKKNENDTMNYTIPAEFVYPKYYHKKGVLAAARTGDNVNPRKESSSSQFYIVTGTVFSEQELKMIEKQRFEKLKQTIFGELQLAHRDSIKEMYRNGEKEKMNALRDSIITETEKLSETRKAESLLNEVEKNDYMTIGGSPHLDGEYTIFGEVVEGMDVVDKIQEAETSPNDRPLVDIKMKIRRID
ncbi:peptidylprolyl isomerase [Dysgonomonas sp. 216]|uniref:peptidylprolyl isomerase n=1 Tax=Dysgonomonas sp. 216 TaxID=2302934 RepID=UPI0013D37BAB|nr:peptidylprolyl isomerase [Dysgonomonas sp. 216]NDW18802.1 peptidylprolyl isomerase [Dysgonomonas sp. 216]